MKKVIIDTSIWIEYFKGNEDAANIIHDQSDLEIYLTGPILTELIQGIKTENEKTTFLIIMESLLRIPITDQDWVDAGKIGNDLRKKGVTVPIADLIIYTVALNNNCTLYTLDNHFSLVNKTIEANIEIISL